MKRLKKWFILILRWKIITKEVLKEFDEMISEITMSIIETKSKFKNKKL